uniref:Glutamate--cysteine ligase n=1 Tax=Accipiter nisus TaxID=211598 RepID=A0A8B9RXQ5_9AVES
MGLLSQGSPLSWEETRRHAEHVRKHGILQFLHIYRALRDRHKDVLKWGDEVRPPPHTPPPQHTPRTRPARPLRDPGAGAAVRPGPCPPRCPGAGPVSSAAVPR